MHHRSILSQNRRRFFPCMQRRQASSKTAAAAAAPEQASPAALAKAFALAASGALASGGRGNVVRGAGGSGVGREERYYLEGGDGKTQGAASAALPDDQVFGDSFAYVGRPPCCKLFFVALKLGVGFRQ